MQPPNLPPDAISGLANVHEVDRGIGVPPQPLRTRRGHSTIEVNLGIHHSQPGFPLAVGAAFTNAAVYGMDA